jgi:DNA-binding YbaB/EbfC family protein
MKNLGNLLKQAQDMQTKMAEVEAGLDRLEVEGTSGGGMVRVTLSGRGAMRRVALDRTLIKPEEAEVLEDLIVAAHNDAKMKLEARVKEEMGKIAEGLGLPPGFKLPF